MGWAGAVMVTITPAQPSAPPFTFNYTQYVSPSLSISQLDNIANTVFNPAANTNVFSRIMSILLLAGGLAYIFVRSKMVDQQMQIAKQNYEAAQNGTDQGAVNNQNPAGP
jgi:beta-lactamase regulating signal transducer with metallopeptidase domain